MVIGILGGKFDPPHRGHLNMAFHLISGNYGLDQVWFMPVNVHPWKTIIASSTDRLQMVKLLENEYLKASDIELKRGGISFTVDTVSELLKDATNKYMWIIGSDQLPSIKNWKDFPLLASRIPFLVFPRDRQPLNNLPSNFIISKNSYQISTMSSTLIRDKIKKSQIVTRYLTPEVFTYIQTHNLYK